MKISPAWLFGISFISFLFIIVVTFLVGDRVVLHKTILKDYSFIEFGTPSYPQLKSFNFTFKSLSEVWADLYEVLPNFPTSYGINKLFYLGHCSNYPTIWDIKFNNMFWQRYLTTNGTFYLYSAHLDIRAVNNHGPAIRIISMMDNQYPSMKTYCHIWTNESVSPIIVEALGYKFLWLGPEANTDPLAYKPYMITCVLPDQINHTIPLSVSLVEERCAKPTNNLRVVFNHPLHGQKKSPFAVCVKGLSYPTIDFSSRLIEWLELLNVLGAEKVFLYSFGVHPNVQKVLDYYSKTGFAELTVNTLPGFLPIQPILQYIYLQTTLSMQMLTEMVQYHDCLYRNMYMYEYLALIDVDEVMIPLIHDDWHQLVKYIVEKTNINWSTIIFRNIFYLSEMLEYHQSQNPYEVQNLLKDVPPYLHMMSNVYRHENHSHIGHGVKSFVNAEQILMIHNHTPLMCLGPNGCVNYGVEETDGRLQHYRKDCNYVFGANCENAKNQSVLDTSIWKFKDKVVRGSIKVMKEIGFFD